MWGEVVDASDLEQTLWPRLAAVAEQLWSPQSITNATLAINSAYPRLSEFRCLLNRRGVRAAPANNHVARGPPAGPGGCLGQ
jgi:hexosaminidase